MISDFITFLRGLFTQTAGAGSILPDDLGDLLPIDQITQFYGQLTDSMKIFAAVLTLILALLACFLGYKFCRLFMTITGFFGGILLGFTISKFVLKLDAPLVILITLAAGLILSIFAYRVYVAGIFILCFMLAFVAAAALLPLTGDLQFFLSTLIAFFIGSLSIRFIRPVIILTSAIVGGSIASGLITSLCGLMNIYTFTKFTAGGVTLILCILGILVQFMTTSDKDEEKRRKKQSQKKQKKREAKRRKENQSR